MINSILIGKVIYQLLALDSTLVTKLTATIDGKSTFKVYPLIANDNTTFPYIVYRKENIAPTLCKDGYMQDTVSFSIIVNDINYDTCCDIANRVRNIFQFMRYTTNDMYITDCHLVNIDENWVAEAFVQMLNFSCTVNQK